MKSLLGIPVAVGILVVVMALGIWLNWRNDRIFGQQLIIEATVPEMIRLKQEMNNMLRLSVLERNPLRHTGYHGLAGKLADASNTLTEQTRETPLFSEIQSLQTDQVRFEQMEARALALMSRGQWDEARRLVFGDEYRLREKIYAINAETAVLAMKEMHAATRQQLLHLHGLILALTFSALTLLLWAGRQFSQRLRGEITGLRQSEAALAASEDALRRLSTHQQVEMEADRKRMAQEIHDELGQRLTVLRIDVALLPCAIQPDSAGLPPASVSALKESIDGILTIVRDLAGKLRPATLEIGLEAAAAGLVQEFRDTLHIPCDFDDQLPAGLLIDEDRATGLFRILQESLTNAARHAHADRIAVRLSLDHDQLRLEVQDDGRGFADTPARSFGLSGMQERAIAMGGTLTVRSALNAGTTVEALIPLDCIGPPTQVRHPPLPGDGAEMSPAVDAPSVPEAR